MSNHQDDVPPDVPDVEFITPEDEKKLLSIYENVDEYFREQSRSIQERLVDDGVWE